MSLSKTITVVFEIMIQIVQYIWKFFYVNTFLHLKPEVNK